MNNLTLVVGSYNELIWVDASKIIAVESKIKRDGTDTLIVHFSHSNCRIWLQDNEVNKRNLGLV